MNLDWNRLLGVRRGPGEALLGDCLAGSGGRIFGGQALGQALVAAGTSLDMATDPPASIHGHFLRPGDVAAPLEFAVESLKDGRHFVVRRVDARQGDRLVLTATATFHAWEHAPEHQSVPPAVRPPEQCRRFFPEEFGAKSPAYGPVEAMLGSADSEVPSLAVWLRLASELPADPLLHASGVAWLSDLALTRTVDLPRRHWRGFRQGASLDHTIWFHRPTDPASWLLASHTSESYTGARGLARGQFYDESGILRATAVQECLIRRPPTEPQ